MTVLVKHSFTSLKSDGTDPTVVQPSNWNDAHVITVASLTLLGRTSNYTGPVEELPITSWGVGIVNTVNQAGACTYIGAVNKTGDTMTGTLTAPTLASTGNITAGGNITASGNITAYSDVRLKTDIQTLTNALKLIDQLHGVRYTMKATGEINIGVIAQETEMVLPEVVRTDGQGVRSVAYGNLTALLIEGVKELLHRVEKLEAARDGGI